MIELRVEAENDRILAGDTAITVYNSEGEPMAIDHVGTEDGYVAFLSKAADGLVNVDGDEVSLQFMEVRDGE